MNIGDYAVDPFGRLCLIIGFTKSKNGVRTIMAEREDESVTTYPIDELRVIGDEHRLNMSLKVLRLYKLYKKI